MADSFETVTVYMGTRGVAVTSVILVFNTIASVLLSLRLWARIKMSKNLGRDDVMLVIGFVSRREILGMASRLCRPANTESHLASRYGSIGYQPHMVLSLRSYQALCEFHARSADPAQQTGLLELGPLCHCEHVRQVCNWAFPAPNFHYKPNSNLDGVWHIGFCSCHEYLCSDCPSLRMSTNCKTI